MRAVKATLMTAAALKHMESTNDSEEGLIYRALYDCNVPKLLSEDIPLFQAILSDLFPGISVQAREYKLLKAAMEKVCKELGLQAVPSFIDKCLQLYETTKVLFSITSKVLSYLGSPWHHACW
jgi:dynein heavy chain